MCSGGLVDVDARALESVRRVLRRAVRARDHLGPASVTPSEAFACGTATIVALFLIANAVGALVRMLSVVLMLCGYAVVKANPLFVALGAGIEYWAASTAAGEGAVLIGTGTTATATGAASTWASGLMATVAGSLGYLALRDANTG